MRRDYKYKCAVMTSEALSAFAASQPGLQALMVSTELGVPLLRVIAPGDGAEPEVGTERDDSQANLINLFTTTSHQVCAHARVRGVSCGRCSAVWSM